MAKIRSHEELDVYQLAFASAMTIFKLTSLFPKEERYGLTNQIRRSSRSVCANIAEAFRKRRYPAYFIAKLIDSEGEAAETLVWLQFAKECSYLHNQDHEQLIDTYNRIIKIIVAMSLHPERWEP
jgi:four helix bundle protein